VSGDFKSVFQDPEVHKLWDAVGPLSECEFFVWRTHLFRKKYVPKKNSLYFLVGTLLVEIFYLLLNTGGAGLAPAV
jgi:hypothetical protein